MGSIELAIFDMAGTTVEDRDEVYQAFETALITHTSWDTISEEEIRASM